MSRKTNSYPDSDETARHPDADLEAEEMDDDPGNIEGRQTSNKSGKHSSVEKLAASRPEFGTRPGARPKEGAFGHDNPVEAAQREPNRFHCDSCGRDFTSQSEFSRHEIECRLAKEAAHPRH